MLPRHTGRLRQESGQAVVEYAVLLAIASLGIVFALLILRDSIGTTVQGTSTQIDAASAAAPPLGASAGGGSGTGVSAPGGGTADEENGGGGGWHGHGGGNGTGNSGNGNGNGGPNGRKN